MKILYVISGLNIGGAEQIVRQLAYNFAKEGHHVTILILSGHPINVPYSDKIEITSLNISKNIFLIPLLIFNFFEVIRKVNPDIVHSHMYHSNILARLTRIFLKIPILISTAHSNNEGGGFRMFMYRITNFLSDAFTNVSQDAINEFEKKGAVSKNKMIKIYNGINIDLFTKNDNLERSIDIKNPIFLSVGSLTELKDHKNLINAFYILTKEVEGARLIIAGDGPLKNNLLQLTTSLNITSKISFIGISNDIPNLMKQADIFLLSSTHEGFGLVLAEAMASKLLVIATNCGGSKEVIGDCGFLVPTKNASSLAEAMKIALNLPANEKIKRQDLGRERVIENFNFNNIFKQWEALYISKFNNLNNA